MRCSAASSLLAREPAVRDNADEERGDQRADRGRAIGQADIRIGEMQRLPQVGAHGHEPDAPDEILQEHHQRETRDHQMALTRPIRRDIRASGIDSRRRNW